MHTLSETDSVDRQKNVPLIGGVLTALAMGAGIWLAIARQPAASTIQAADPPPVSVPHAAVGPVTVDLDSPQQWMNAPVEDPPVVIGSVQVERPRVRRAVRRVAAVPEVQRPAPLNSGDSEGEVTHRTEDEITAATPPVEEPVERIEPRVPAISEPEVISSIPEIRPTAPKRTDHVSAPRPQRKTENPPVQPRSAKASHDRRPAGETMADWHRRFLDDP